MVEIFIYYLVILSSMENISLKLDTYILRELKRVMKRYFYSTKTEFIREAIRDKMAELETKEILADKDLMSQIRESERNIKKGKTYPINLQ